MRSHITPVPTPPIVRVSASVLVGASVTVLTTNLAPEVKLGVVVAGLALAILITLAHPYRAQVKAYRARHTISAIPTLGRVMPLFITWFALMLAPVISGAPLWASVLVWIIVAGWVFLTFPHVDGTRALAFADEPRRNT